VKKVAFFVVVGVAGVFVSLLAPLLLFRISFNATFETSCRNAGAPANVCECARVHVVDRAGILDYFDSSRLKRLAAEAGAACRDP
jgi:hypothetical protein